MLSMRETNHGATQQETRRSEEEESYTTDCYKEEEGEGQNEAT